MSNCNARQEVTPLIPDLLPCGNKLSGHAQMCSPILSLLFITYKECQMELTLNIQLVRLNILPDGYLAELFG